MAQSNKSSPKQQNALPSLFEDTQWSALKLIVSHKLSEEKHQFVSDQILILSQAELLEEIKERISRLRQKESLVCQSIEILPIDSSLSNINSVYNFQNDDSLMKNKFTEEFQYSLLTSTLKEVKNSCSEETYDTVKNYLLNHKQKEFQTALKSLEKIKKQNQDLSLQVILKQNQIQRLRDQNIYYESRLETIDEDKRKIKVKNDFMTEKEKRIHKAEMTLIFKEKINQESKKKIERMTNFKDNQETKLQAILKELSKVWQGIIQLMDGLESKQCCSESEQKICWKKQTMKKCREKLLEERNVLKEEEKQLERQYETMESISEQFKKLISDQQEGLRREGGSTIKSQLSAEPGLIYSAVL